MYRGGEEVAVDEGSGLVRREGEDKGWVCWLTGELAPCGAGIANVIRGSVESGGESLRFLWEDVVRVKALLPEGNKAR